MFSRKFFSVLAAAAVLQLPVSLPLLQPQPAFAIPRRDAVSKLKYIVVYLVAKGPEEFIFAQQGDYSFVSVFLTKEAAQAQLDSFVSQDPSFDGYLQRYTLNELYPIIESVQKKFADQSQNVLFPIVTQAADSQKAIELLQADGLSESVIKENLRVPVFFTEPMINLETVDQGKKQYFFLEYATLQSVLDQLPPGNADPKINVLNLDQVLQVIIDKDDDIYGIFPTQQYLLEQQN